MGSPESGKALYLIGLASVIESSIKFALYTAAREPARVLSTLREG